MDNMQFQPAEKLPDVLARIVQIREYFVAQNSPLAYFAALYTKVAQAIEANIEQGNMFDDNARMARMDVHFVNLYIDAMNAAAANTPALPHWQLVIDTAKDNQVLVLEHMFLAINAHINYDLAIAADETCTTPEIMSFKADFNRINDILFKLVDVVQTDFSLFFHPLKWYLKLGRQLDDRILTLALGGIRSDSWGFACEMALCNAEQKKTLKTNRMDLVVSLGKVIINPKIWWMSVLLFIARRIERGTVASRTKDLLK